MSGTYSFLDEHGRGYVNFNADRTFTTTAPLPYTFDDANTLSIFGIVFKRTQPN